MRTNNLTNKGWLREILWNFKIYKRIIILAILLRIFFMPFLFHPDIKTQYYHANFLKEGVFNIYQYIKINKENLGYKDTFNYPPLTYYFLGGWAWVTSPLLGQPFNNWLEDWSESWYTNPQIFRQMFILKVPYLFLDLLLGLTLVTLLNEVHRKKALILWFFNPLTIYIIYGLSNFDIIPTFFSLLSLYFFQKDRYLLSGISLGFGVATKIFPALFLPLFLLPLLKEKKLRRVIEMTMGAVGVFVFSIAFLYKDFLSISGSGLLTGILVPKLPVTENFSIPLFYLLYGAVLLYSFLSVHIKWERLNLTILAVVLIILSLTKFHPQWFLWALPFLLILLVQNLRLIYPSILLVLGFLLMVLGFEDRFLTLGILSPILPNIYTSGFLEKTLFFVINKTTLLLAETLFITIGSLGVLIWGLRYVHKNKDVYKK